jgi:hypothetical protein
VSLPKYLFGNENTQKKKELNSRDFRREYFDKVHPRTKIVKETLNFPSAVVFSKNIKAVSFTLCYVSNE